MQRVEIGGLQCVQVKGHADAPHIIIFHGYGANCMDLAPLSSELQLPDHLNWYFPDGILELAIGPGMTGKAWFPIDTMALQAAIEEGSYRELTRIRPTGLDSALEKSLALIHALGVAPEKLIIGGFSQGAMLSTEICLNMDANPAALLLLSGTLLDAENWKTKAPLRSGTPFFQSHGNQDPLLDPGAAQQLNQILNEAGLNGQLHSFNGGHELPMPVLIKLREFLLDITNNIS